jgi:hypothetical protein
LQCDVVTPSVCCVPQGQPCTATTVCCGVIIGVTPIPGACDVIGTMTCSLP